MQNLGIIEGDSSKLDVLKGFLSKTDSLNCILAVSDTTSLIHWYRPYMEIDLLLYSIPTNASSIHNDFQKIQKLIPNVKIIILSSNLDDGVLFKCLRAGAYGFLYKDTPFNELQKHLEAVESGGSPLSPQVARRVVNYFQPVVKSHENIVFSHKESMVIKLLVEGNSYKEIAHQMDVKLPNVSYYIKNIYRKLGVHSKIEVMKKFNEGELKI